MPLAARPIRLLPLVFGAALLLAPHADAARARHAPACSAQGLPRVLPAQAGLPPVVARTRAALVKSAARCDFTGLEAIASRNPGTFTFSYGASSQPAAFWRAEETRGAHPLRAIVKLLAMPYTRVSGGLQYVWPAAYADTPKPTDWAALGGLYKPEAIAHFKQVGYLGYRIGIGQSGEWLFLVQGD